MLCQGPDLPLRHDLREGFRPGVQRATLLMERMMTAARQFRSGARDRGGYARLPLPCNDLTGAVRGIDPEGAYDGPYSAVRKSLVQHMEPIPLQRELREPRIGCGDEGVGAGLCAVRSHTRHEERPPHLAGLGIVVALCLRNFLTLSLQSIAPVSWNWK